jgi:23S rRNA (uracil1939-C5)-methyltransferase
VLLTIEKLIYGGDALARLPADEHGRGKAVFLPFVLAGEKVEATVLEQKPGFARARADSIVEPSTHRVEPACPYFLRCGGCHYQHASYGHQLQIKEQILRETLRRIAKLELACPIQITPSPPWNYRNRSRLQVRTQPGFVAGYYKLASHDVLPVEDCPISSPLINRGIAALWNSGRAGRLPEGAREVELFADADDTQLLVEVSCDAKAKRGAVRAWTEELCSSLPEISGVAAFRETKPGASEQLVITGASSLTYKTKDAAYRVSAGSFFQANRFLIDKLVEVVTAGRSGESALDLYAGVGLFSTVLARDFHHIFSVEASQLSTDDLQYNLPSNGDAIRATTEQFLSHSQTKRRVGKGIVLPHTIHTPDLAVVDPPRGGMGERVARSLANLGAPRVIYVACDPATLARDLIPLVEAGYRVEQAHLVDLFPQTYHLESILHLVR